MSASESWSNLLTVRFPGPKNAVFPYASKIRALQKSFCPALKDGLPQVWKAPEGKTTIFG